MVELYVDAAGRIACETHLRECDSKLLNTADWYHIQPEETAVYAADLGRDPTCQFCDEATGAQVFDRLRTRMTRKPALEIVIRIERAQ